MKEPSESDRTPPPPPMAADGEGRKEGRKGTSCVSGLQPLTLARPLAMPQEESKNGGRSAFRDISSEGCVNPAPPSRNLGTMTSHTAAVQRFLRPRARHAEK